MEHLNGILFYKSGLADKQYTNQSISVLCIICIIFRSLDHIVWVSTCFSGFPVQYYDPVATFVLLDCGVSYASWILCRISAMNKLAAIVAATARPAS